MTQEEVMEQVREKIAVLLYHKYIHAMGWDDMWEDEPEGVKEIYQSEATQFLNDNPEILIKDPDQSFPEFLTIGDISKMELVDATRASMLKENWVKVLKEKK